MGLLTGTRTQAFVSRLVLTAHKPLELLLYIAGIGSLLALAFAPLNARTYFSENALLPGLVERKYQNDHGVRDSAKEMARLAAIDNGRAAMPVEWVQEQFTQLGLDVFTQNFTVMHPFLDKKSDGQTSQTIAGTNVYAILRAPRIASTEAMVITVPYRNKESGKMSGQTHIGIGLVLSLANFFSKKTYWSKDIIFVIVDKEEVGMQAWLEGYHDSHTKYIQSSVMLGRSGGIIAAINLELGSEFTDHIDVKIEGVNGQLPNLDLFNLAVRLCRVENVQVTFQNRRDAADRLAVHWEGFQHSATTMLLNMAKQASGNPSGIHGLFLRYHIEALTLQAYPAKRSGSGLVAVGRVIEGVVRSINNLLERFHQSFFFYVLPGCDRYVSIGLYMIPFGLLLFVPTLHGMALWLLAGQCTEENEKSTEKVEESDERKDENVKEVAKESRPMQHRRPIGQVMPIITGSHIIGGLLFISPEYFISDHIASFSISPQQGVTVGFLAFFIGVVTLPLYGRKNNFRSSDGSTSDWQLLKSLTLIWYTVTLLAASMSNFSLAFFVAVPTIPVAVLVRPANSRILKAIYGILLILISPMALLYAYITLYQGYMNPKSPVSEIIFNGAAKTVNSLFEGVLNSYLYGNKTFALVTLVWFPVWFLLWVVLFRQPCASKV